MKLFEISNAGSDKFASRIDEDAGNEQNATNMRRPARQIAAFSLVEVTLALGVAAICLITMLGLLPASLKTQQSSIQQTRANQIIAQVSSILKADIALPPGLATKVCPDPPDPNQPCAWGDLHGHWLLMSAPDRMYFTNDGRVTGNVNAGSPPADAVFRVKITYRFPPSETTSLADIAVSWPAAVDPDNGGVPAGYILTTLAVNR
jgi:type II secretory pathway pseudopilin PulG